MDSLINVFKDTCIDIFRSRYYRSDDMSYNYTDICIRDSSILKPGLFVKRKCLILM